MGEWPAGNAASSGVGITNFIGHGVACRCSQCARFGRAGQYLLELAKDNDQQVAERVLEMSKNRDQLLCKAADMQRRFRWSVVPFVLGVVAGFCVLWWLGASITAAIFFSVLAPTLSWLLALHNVSTERASLKRSADDIGKAIIAAKFAD